MKRTTLPLLAGLLLLGACMERELPTALAPEGAAFHHVGASYQVTKTSDSGEGSLRYAIEHVEAGGTITFAAELNGQTITLTSGTLNIYHDLTIAGPGASQLTVERASSATEFRIFDVHTGKTAAISGITISGGHASGSNPPAGGGIYNSGTLTLTNSTISGNSSNGAGGIHNDGTLTLLNSTVSGNSAGRSGGGGIINFGTLTLMNSTVSGNSAIGNGGGILNREGTLTLMNSTVSGNSAGRGGGGGNGGGIDNSGTLTLTNSTISGNSADGGGGIYSNTSNDLSTTSTTILNSTISGNTATVWGGGVGNFNGLTRIVHGTITGNQAGDGGGGVWSWNDGITRTDVKGSLIWGNTTDGTHPNDVAAGETTNRFNSLGHNLIGASGNNVDFSQEFNQTGDQTGVGAGGWLGPLALNAPGTTETHALLAGSPAIDAGVCTDHENLTVATDQRGVSRPQGNACDIGAYELEQSAAEITFKTSSSAMTNAPSGNASRTLTIPRPDGVSAGDLLLAQITFEKGSDAGSDAQLTPSGWTLVRRTNRGSDLGQAIFYKVATANEPDSYSFPFRQAVKAAGAVLAYSGVHTASPIVASSGAGGDSRTLTAPSVNAEANSMLVAFYGFKKKDTTLSVPSGMEGLYNYQNPQDVTIRAAEELRESAGPTGERISEPSPRSSDKWVAQLVVLRRAH